MEMSRVLWRMTGRQCPQILRILDILSKKVNWNSRLSEECGTSVEWKVNTGKRLIVIPEKYEFKLFLPLPTVGKNKTFLQYLMWLLSIWLTNGVFISFCDSLA